MISFQAKQRLIEFVLVMIENGTSIRSVGQISTILGQKGLTLFSAGDG